MTATIAMLLAARMAEKGITDTEAARLLEVSQPTITRWRAGRSVPAESSVPHLARFLGISQTKVRHAIDATQTRPTGKPADPSTFGALLRRLEDERNLTGAEAWRRYGIDKSRYYRLRSDLSTPLPADIPALSTVLHVPEETLVLAAYRTELRRVGL